MKKFLLKGPKYRPPSIIKWNECRKVINDALSVYCKKWTKREEADKKALDAFFHKCMSIVDNRIQFYELNYKQQHTPTSISALQIKLKDLGKRFVFVPADKTANNVVVV